MLCWWCGGVVVEVVVWWWRLRCGGGGGDVVEVEGGAVSSLYSQCILTVSSLYPSKERCLWSSAASKGCGWWWQRRWRVAEAEGGGV